MWILGLKGLTKNANKRSKMTLLVAAEDHEFVFKTCQPLVSIVLNLSNLFEM